MLCTEIGLQSAAYRKELSGQFAKVDGGGDNNVIAILNIIVNALHLVDKSTSLVRPAVSAIDTRCDLACADVNDLYFALYLGDDRVDQTHCVASETGRTVKN